MPQWVHHPIDPISISDVLYYLVAAADPENVPAGAYDIHGPESTTYRGLMLAYARLSGKWRAGVPVWGVPTALLSRVTAVALPVPGGLAADLVESLDHPMMASDDGLAGLVPDPPGGLVGIDDAISRAFSSPRRLPVNALADSHHLADSDPDWAGGDVSRIRQLAAMVTPAFTRPALGLFNAMPGPAAAALRTGLDTLIGLASKGMP
jgi:hypothetical protein